MSDFNNSIVSIIMPAYNAGKTIGASIESVLAQDYLSWELIIINDCSDDETMDIINNFTTSDSRIKVASLKKNSGISEARNTGIRVAIGRYLAFLDSDDLWKFNKLSRQLEFMATEEHFFTFTGYELMNSNGELLSKTVNAKNRVDYKNLLTNNCIGCLTVIIDRKHIPKIIMPKIKH
jgi:teichuronic acid biosynthesis glycosyltransferase TuaG